MKQKSLFIYIFLAGIAIRLFFLIFGLLKMPINVDESWVGLMAMHILKGEFPIVYWGQSYMGTQEAYIDAPLIWLFGANAFSLRIYPFIWSVLFMFFSYKLASRIYNEEVGLITFLLLALPSPYLSMASAVVHPDNYIAAITLGSIAFIITYDLVFNDPKRRIFRFALLGFILGYAFWLHILVVSYIGLVLLFLFLKDKLLIFRKGFWILVLMFIIGSLPLLYYNMTHNFATFHDVAGGVDLVTAIGNLRKLFKVTLHFLLGFKIMLCADVGYFADLPSFLYFSTGVILSGLVIYVIITKFKNIWRICFLSLKKVDGTSLLFVMAIFSIYTFCRSRRTDWFSVRYILPIMSVLPIIFAYGMWGIKRFSRAGFYALISIILLASGWGNFLLIERLNDSAFVREELDIQDTRPLVEFLRQNNIFHAYANYCIAYNLTYETREEIICAPPYNERFTAYDVPFIEEVRRDDNVAYIMHKNLGIKPEDFENRLRIIGGRYKKKELDSYTVFYAFEPPYKERRLNEISRNKWKVSSNFKPEDCSYAIDGDLITRWGSGAPQCPRMWFSVDLGDIYYIAKIRFDLGRFITDYPRGYKVEVSVDNRDWTTVIEIPDNTGGLFWEGSHPRFMVNGDFFTASFPPIKVRFLKITQIGTDPRFDWSIAELRVYG